MCRCEVGELATWWEYKGAEKVEIEKKGHRLNAGKPMLSMILGARKALIGIARVLEFGAIKYARDDWKKGLDPLETMDSLLRHASAYCDGEYLDPESGLPHVDHIACNALFISHHTNRDTGDGMLK